MSFLLALILAPAAQAVDNSASASLGCFFMTELGVKYDCNHEYDEQKLAKQYLAQNSSVLELGSRYGVMSCAISQIQKGSGKLIAVEPDGKVQNANKLNKMAKNCNYKFVHGAVSNTPIYSSENWVPLGESTVKEGEGARFLALKTKTPQLTVDKLQKDFKMKIDTIVADCEGCFIDFIEENPALADQLNTVILEVDYKNKEQKYEKAFDILKNAGLKEVGLSKDIWEHKVFLRA
jgi:FkbM family methyltransferase